MNELGNTPADKNYKPSGISKAEEMANKRWPIHPWSILPKEGEHGEIINFDEWLDDFRIGVQSFSLNAGYREGYEQAEKDLALTWEDMQLIWQICDTIKDTERKNPDIMCSSRAFFSEVPKRFKEAKK